MLFKVRDIRTDKTYIVYAVKQLEGIENPKFLIYDECEKWSWINAGFFVPVEE